MEAALRAIASPRRREILRLVWDKELSSGEIAARFDVSWPAISQNLQVLKEAGLVRQRRIHNQRLYQTNRKAIRPLLTILRQMWDADLDRLAEFAEAEERRKR